MTLRLTMLIYLLVRSSSYVARNNVRRRFEKGAVAPFGVYIESTDAFGMMFYANFPILVERALVAESGTSLGLLTSLKEMKFRNPARLGDTLTLTCSDAKVTCSNQKGDDIFVATKAALGVRGVGTRLKEIDLDKELTAVQKMVRFKLWPDELSENSRSEEFPDDFASGTGLFVPTRTIFNLFERGRTEALGGPHMLAAAQASKTHVYVARINDFAASLSVALEPRSSEVYVVSNIKPVGLSMVEFSQAVVCALSEAVVARAKILCVAVNSDSGDIAAFNPEMSKALGIWQG